jgi:hypothetical protein
MTIKVCFGTRPLIIEVVCPVSTRGPGDVIVSIANMASNSTSNGMDLLTDDLECLLPQSNTPQHLTDGYTPHL